MINKLTREQETNIGVVKNYWLNKVYNCEPLNKSAAEELITWMYERINKDKPNILYMDSPLGAQLMANILVRNNIGNNIWDSIRDNIGDSIRDSIEANIEDNIENNIGANIWNNIGANIWNNIGNNIRDSIGNNIGNNIWNNIGANIWDSIEDNIGNNIRANIRDNIEANIEANIEDNIWNNIGANIEDNIWNNIGANIWNNIWNNIGANIWNNIRNNIGDNIGDSIRDSIGANIWNNIRNNIWANIEDNIRDNIWDSIRDNNIDKLQTYHSSYYGSILFSHWVAWGDFYYRTNTILEGEWDFVKFCNLVDKANIYYLLTFENVAILVGAPEYIHKAEQGGLNVMHDHEGNMAVKWRDGYGQWILNGVDLAKEVYNEIIGGKADFGKVMSIENMEHRMLYLKYLDTDKLLDGADAELLNVGDKKTVHFDYSSKNKLGAKVTRNKLYKVSGIFAQDEYFVRYEDPSTGRVYMSCVDPVVGAKKDADLCMAWKFGLSKEMYMQLKNEA